MPVGPYKTFADCVSAQRRKGLSEKAAGAYCGSIEKKMHKSKMNVQNTKELLIGMKATIEMILEYLEEVEDKEVMMSIDDTIPADLKALFSDENGISNEE